MSKNRRFLCTSAQLVMIAYMLTACAHKPAALPPRADVLAMVEAKPKPPAAILTDPAASDRYSSSLEAWGDRLSSAGKRLCVYFRETGMRVECPQP